MNSFVYSNYRNLTKRILSKRLTYLLIAVLAQFWTLLKPFPDELVSFCNFRVKPIDLISVAVNCDSKDFLLDSQDLVRMTNGVSPEMDRPLPALTIYLFSRLLIALGIPRFMIDYIGEDGVLQSYSALNYSLFVLINFGVLLTSISMMFSLFSRVKIFTDVRSIILYSLLGTLAISQNYITANFMWTPHTTVFSLLIPVFILRILADYYIEKSKFSNKFFYVIAVLIFCHPLFLVPLFLIVLYSNLKWIKKLFLIFIPISLYLSIPQLTEYAFGTSTPNMSFTNHKRVVWILDSSDQNLVNPLIDLLQNLGALILNGSWMIYLLLLFQLWLLFVKRVVSSKDLFNSLKFVVLSKFEFGFVLSLLILMIFFIVVGVTAIRHSIVIQLTLFLFLLFKNLQITNNSRRYLRIESLIFLICVFLIQLTSVLPRTIEY